MISDLDSKAHLQGSKRHLRCISTLVWRLTSEIRSKMTVKEHLEFDNQILAKLRRSNLNLIRTKLQTCPKAVARSNGMDPMLFDKDIKKCLGLNREETRRLIDLWVPHCRGVERNPHYLVEIAALVRFIDELMNWEAV